MKNESQAQSDTQLRDGHKSAATVGLIPSPTVPSYAAPYRTHRTPHPALMLAILITLNTHTVREHKNCSDAPIGRHFIQLMAEIQTTAVKALVKN